MHAVFQEGGAYASKFAEVKLILEDTSRFHLLVFVCSSPTALQEALASLVLAECSQYSIHEHRFTAPTFDSVGRFAQSLPKESSPKLIVAHGLESVLEDQRSNFLTLLNNHREDFKFSNVSLALFVQEETYGAVQRLSGDFLAWAKTYLFTDPDVRVKPSVVGQRTVQELTDYSRRIAETAKTLELPRLYASRRVQLLRDLAHYHKQLGQTEQAEHAEREALALAEKTEDRSAAEQLYLDSVIDDHRYLEVRGLAQAITSVTLELDQVFVALQAERGRTWTLPFERSVLESGNDTPDMAALASQLISQATETLELSQAVSENNALVILGDPGSGKTTLLRFLAYQFASARSQRQLTVTDSQGNNYGKPLVPVYVRISRFAEALAKKPNRTFRTFLLTSAGRESEHDATYRTIIERALDNGEALLLLDGLDEVTEPSQRTAVVEKLESFTRKLKQGNKIVLSSRIVGYSDVPLGHPFQQTTYTLCPMDESRIQKFAERWCLAVERTRTPLSDNQIVVSNAQKQTDALLQAVHQNPGVRELAGNPLLLTLLALIQRDRIRLPERRVELYEAAAETLLRTWNYTRGYRERDLLSEHEVQAILGPLALYMHEHCPSGLIEERDAHEQLALAISAQRGTPPDSVETKNAVDDFLRRIRDTSGLFIERAPKQYGFLHLTFEEYYAAMELISDTFEAAEKIAKYRFKPRWEEPIRLAIASLRPKDATRIIKEALWNPDGELKYPDPWGEILDRGFILAFKCTLDQNDIERSLLDNIQNTYLRSMNHDINNKNYAKFDQYCKLLPLYYANTKDPIDKFHSILSDKNLSVVLKMRISNITPYIFIKNIVPFAQISSLLNNQSIDLTVRRLCAASISRYSNISPTITDFIFKYIAENRQQIEICTELLTHINNTTVFQINRYMSIISFLETFKDFDMSKTLAGKLNIIINKDQKFKDYVIYSINNKSSDVRLMQSLLKSMDLAAENDSRIRSMLLGLAEDITKNYYIRSGAISALHIAAEVDVEIAKKLVNLINQRHRDYMLRSLAASTLRKAAANYAIIADHLMHISENDFHTTEVRISCALALDLASEKHPYLIPLRILPAIDNYNTDDRVREALVMSVMNSLHGNNKAVEKMIEIAESNPNRQSSLKIIELLSIASSYNRRSREWLNNILISSSPYVNYKNTACLFYQMDFENILPINKVVSFLNSDKIVYSNFAWRYLWNLSVKNLLSDTVPDVEPLT